MRGSIFGSLVGLALVVGSLPARSDRDIVYAARYYYPPGDHRISHSHLYRINPDGTGRLQITYGSGDDLQPKWSPDGTRIAFERRFPSPNHPDETYAVLCVVKARGGPITMLRRYEDNLEFDIRWSHDGSALLDGVNVTPIPGRKPHVQAWEQEPWTALSPDERYLYEPVEAGSDEPNSITDRRSGKQVTLSFHLDCPVWLDGQRLAGVLREDAQSPGICILGVDGNVRSRSRFQPIRGTKVDYNSPVGTEVNSIETIPGDTQHILWRTDESVSTIRPLWGYYKVDIHTGRAAPMADGQFLVWSPDGRRYCTAYRELVPYGKPRKGRTPFVWGAQLRIVSTLNGRARDLTSGYVWVSQADWRQVKRP